MSFSFRPTIDWGVCFSHDGVVLNSLKTMSWSDPLGNNSVEETWLGRYVIVIIRSSVFSFIEGWLISFTKSVSSNVFSKW